MPQPQASIPAFLQDAWQSTRPLSLPLTQHICWQVERNSLVSWNSFKVDQPHRVLSPLSGHEERQHPFNKGTGCMGAGTSSRSLTSCVRFQALRCLERIVRFPLAGLVHTCAFPSGCFLFQCRAGNQTQGLSCAGQVLCHWAIPHPLSGTVNQHTHTQKRNGS